jgi:uncharacterized membrane protein
MELHEWLTFLHILAAIVWVGGSIMVSAVLTRANRNPDRAVVAGLARELDWVGPRLIGPAAGVVIGLGIWLTIIEDEIAFSDVWIWLSLVLVAVSMVLGMAYFGPEGKRLAGLAAERGPEEAEYQRRMGRLLLLSRVDLLILAVVLWLMVFKPGA